MLLGNSTIKRFSTFQLRIFQISILTSQLRILTRLFDISTIDFLSFEPDFLTYWTSTRLSGAVAVFLLCLGPFLLYRFSQKTIRQTTSATPQGEFPLQLRLDRGSPACPTERSVPRGTSQGMLWDARWLAVRSVKGRPELAALPRSNARRPCLSGGFDS